MESRLLIYLIILITLCAVVNAEAPVLLWNKTFGDTGNDYGESIAVDKDGNLVIVGYLYLGHYDVWTMKLNSQGENIWNTTIGGSGTEYGEGVAIDSENNIIVAARTNTFSQGSWDFFTIKYNSTGSQIWNKTIGTSLAEVPYAVAVDSQDNIIITGFKDGGVSSYDIWTLKYNSTGSLMWNSTYIGPSSDQDFGQGVSIDSNDNVLVTGYIYSTAYDIITIKYNSTGHHQWNYSHSHENHDYGRAVDVDSLDNVISVGYNSHNNLWVIKYNSTGSIIFDSSYITGTYGFAVDIDSEDNIFTSGRKDIVDHGQDFFVMKMNSTGSHIWNATIGGPLNDHAYGVAADDDGNVYVVGDTYSFGAGSEDLWLVKYGISNKLSGSNDSVIIGGLDSLSVKINGSSDLSGDHLGRKSLVFSDQSTSLLNWTHNYAKGEINLSRIIINKTLDRIAFDLGNQLKPGDIHSFNVPAGSTGIYYCPQAKALSQVSLSCTDVIQFTPLEYGSTKYTSDGSYVTAVLEGPSVKITTNSTADDGGGGSGTVPEFSTITLMLALAIVIAGFLRIRRRN